MALEFDADFNGYLDSDYGHGITATYTPSGGSASSIKIIMDQQYYSIPGESIDVEGSQPMAHCKTTDVPNAAYGDDLVVAAVTNLDGTTIKAQTSYKVVGVQPDNTGMTLLILEEQ